jgi:hypothetical protein
VGRARARQCEAGGTRVDLLALPSHLAISRARLFLDLADECTMEQRDRCEAFMEAAIIFCRTALQRARTQYKRRPSWNDWWDRLRTDPNLAFTRQRRNWIVKEAPETFSQVIRPGQPFSFAADCYYYDRRDIRATTTLRRLVDVNERHIEDADARFGQP